MVREEETFFWKDLTRFFLVVEMTPEAVAEGILRLMRDPALYAHIRQYQQSEGKGNEGEIQRVFRILEE